jgi:hypothetical protein
MTANRRDFLKTSAILGGALGVGVPLLASGCTSPVGPEAAPSVADPSSVLLQHVTRAAKPLKI